MPNFSQAGRPIAVTTPLGTDALLLNGFEGVEALSTPFRFTLDLLSVATRPVDFSALLGQGLTVTIGLPGGGSRPIHGIVVSLSQGGRVSAGAGGGGTFLRYRAEVAPSLWRLSRTLQTRTFQQQSVPDILRAVLTGFPTSFQLQGTYKPRDYCVQYRESDLDFAARLMEEEGIFYTFTHTTSSHTMVLSDASAGAPAVAGSSTILYEPVQGGTRGDDRIVQWEKTQEIRPGKVTLWDYCFEMPDKNLAASQPIVGAVQVGTVSHSLQAGGNSGLEVYEFPGGYAQRFDGVPPGGGDQASQLQNIFTDNTRTAAIRMQQEAVGGLIVRGEGNARQLAAGCQFTLANHFDGNGAYLLTRVEHRADLGDAYLQGAAGAGQGFSYTSRFACIPIALPFRPSRSTPRPRIEGPQTAVVVGPKGQEIFTDKYGRVKVQFPWDRLGQSDANSSCWVRVATSWGGKQWGFLQIPRIGQEVVVAFEEGDPDRPLITGGVYNAEQMPPATLPDHMTQSGTISRSTQGGSAENFNQIWFEDKKGNELITVHAEKDMTRVVENNDALTVGSSDSQTCPEGSQTISIYKDRTTSIETGNDTLTVKKLDRSVTISEGNDALTVTKGTRTVSVEGNDTYTVKTGYRAVAVNTGDDTHEIKTGNRAVTIDMGNDTLTIKLGNQTTTLNVGSSTTSALQGITLKCGENSIEIGPSGITIKGLVVSIQGQVQTEVKGLICQVSGDAMLQMKGGITMIN